MRSSFVVATFLALLVAQACTLARDGALDKQCTAASECSDDNPCTVDNCSADGICLSEPLDVALPQTQGDCTQRECSDGLVLQLPDESDVEDDGNACTEDVCNGTAVMHLVEPKEDVPCDAAEGQGVCKGGECKVVCTDVSMCDDLEPCTVDSCNAVSGLCDHANLDNVPSPTQIDGDCNFDLCQGGEAVPAIDDTDLPDDQNDCTDDVCMQGVASYPARATGFPCSGVGQEEVCDGAGTCVECIGPQHCEQLVVDLPDCETVVCVANACQYDYHTPGTLLNPSLQQVGDCQQLVCDGMGNVAAAPMIDNTDVIEDPFDCELHACVAGSEVVTPLALDASCGPMMNLVCSGPPNNLCQGCNDPLDCGVDTECHTFSCNASNTCVQNNTPAGTPTSNQVPQDCLEEQCDGAGNPQQVQVYDPIVDSNVCTQDLCVAGSPQNPPEPLDTSCMSTLFCDGNGACVQCNNDVQCTAGTGVCQSDDCIANACMIVNDAAGDPAPGGFQTGGDCKTVVCDGNGDINPTPQIQNGDLPVDGNQCTQDVCTAGTPSNPPQPAEFPCNQTGGVVCNGSAVMPACVACATDAQCGLGETCDTVTYTCKQLNGQTCTLASECISGQCVDGHCCNQSCVAGCFACDVAGNLGMCTAIPFNTDPDNECVGGSCNGMGGCKLSDGQICSLAADCLSDECVDNVCCDGNCNATCERCNLVGSVGACAPIAFAQDPDSECPNGACDGVGVCKLDPGQTCAVGAACLSAFCTDGVCCDAACAGTCEACSAAGACTPHGAGTDPESECAADVCNGAGQCRCTDGIENGLETDVDCGGSVCPACADTQGCNVASDCQSGVCNAGVCVAPACGDGVVNGGESCDTAIAATPCCAAGCMGIAAAGVVCGADPDGSGCAAPPSCDGATIGIASCIPQTEGNGTLCTSNGLFCDGAETCQAGVCASPGNPCQGADGDNNCAEMCDEAADDCMGNDPNGSACNDGLFCNGTETCSAGVCQNQTGDPCLGPDGDADCQESCNEGGDDCSAADPNGAACDNGSFCDGTESCDGGTCGSPSGDPCSAFVGDADADCSESCDDVLDACVADDAMGSACDNGSFCDGSETCDGVGSCGASSGDPCSAFVGDADTDCSESCDDVADMCSADDPNGSSCSDGLHCTGTETCTAGVCGSATGDPCVGPDGDADCQESCNEAAADCSLDDPNGVTCDNGLFCDGIETCSAGVCGASSGDPCAPFIGDADADCSESCDDALDACMADDPMGAACDNGLYCDGSEICDGMGICGGSSGDPCAGPDGDDDCNETCDDAADNCLAYDGEGAMCVSGVNDQCCSGTCSGMGSCP